MESRTHDPQCSEAKADVLPPLAIIGMSYKLPQDVVDDPGLWNMLLDKRCTSEKAPSSRFNVDAHYHPDNRRPGNTHDPDVPAKYRGIASVPSMLANRVSWFFDLKGPSVSVDTACSSSLLALDLVCQSIWGREATMGLACGSNLMFTPSTTSSLDALGILGKDGRCFSFDHRANGYARGEGIGVLVVKPVDAAIRDGDTIRAIIRSSCSNSDGRTATISNPSQEAQRRLILDAHAKAGLDLGLTRYFEAHGTGTQVGDPTEVGAIGRVFRKYRSSEDPLYVGSIKANVGHLEGAAGVAGVFKAVLVLESGIIPPQANFEKLNPAIDAEFWNIKIPTEAVRWPTTGLRRVSVQSFGIGGANSHVVLEDAYSFMQQRGLRANHNTNLLTGSYLPDLGDTTKDRHSHPNTVTQPPGNICGEEDISKIKDSHPQLLIWSAYDEAGLTRTAQAWKKYMTEFRPSPAEHATHLMNLSYTLTSRRTHFQFRSSAVVRSLDELSTLTDSISTGSRAVADPGVAFVFSGQGGQWHAMGRELLSRYSVYHQSVVDAAVYLKTLGCRWDAVDELMKDEKLSNIIEPEFGQPLCTIVQIALVDLLSSFGIIPSKVIGHSSGEIAAAFQGGMMAVGASRLAVKEHLQSVEEKLGHKRLVVACVNSPRSVTISGDSTHLDHLKRLLDSDPHPVFSRKLKVNVAYHSFQMNEIAEEYLTCLGDLGPPPVAACDLHSAAPVMISTVTGEILERDEMANSEYWARNMISPVLFSDALLAVCETAGMSSTASTLKLDGSHKRGVAITHLVEIGPHSVLQGPIRETIQSVEKGGLVHYSSSLIRNKSAVETVLGTVGHLHCAGYKLKLEVANSDMSINNACRKVLTTLPEYAFNHSKSYWFESRISKSYRFRTFANHDLLGVPAADWNASEARWRHVLQISSHPWIEHHKINGSILYPASGMLVMAIEAAKQLADPSRTFSGFVLQDVRFHSALVILEDMHGSEVNLHMNPSKDDSEKDAGLFKFRIYQHKTSSADEWTEICDGSIQVIYTESKSTHVGSNGGTSTDTTELEKWREGHLRHVSAVNDQCSNKIETKKLYDLLLQSGYEYGPAFQGIQEFHHNDSETAISKISTSCWSRYSKAWDVGSEHVIHPTTLDTILHTMIATSFRSGVTRISTSIPTFIGHMWISAGGGLAASNAETAVAVTRVASAGLRDARSEIFVVDSEQSTVLMDVNNLETTLIAGSDETKIMDVQDVLKPCHTVDWHVDPSLLSASELQRYCDDSIQEPQKLDVDRFADIDFLVTAKIKHALHARAGRPRQDGHRQKYYDWMKHRLELWHSLHGGTMRDLEDEDLIERVMQRMSVGDHESRLYASIAREHDRLLADDKYALDLLFTGTMISNYYRASSQAPGTARLCTLIDTMAHQNPEARIIEIGAGIGSLTDHLMESLTTRSNGSEISLTPRFERYDYTDLSPFFFIEAKERYAQVGSRMRFAALDIEKDPGTQGFELATYDFVIANGVLHATPDLLITLANCRKLLKPGGKLIFAEVTNEDEGHRLNFVFGLLEGWWSGAEPSRQMNPSIGVHQWHDLLQRSGFSGNDLVMPDYQDQRRHEWSLIVSTAIANGHGIDRSIGVGEANRSVTIIYDGTDTKQRTLSAELESHLGKEGFGSISVAPISSITADETPKAKILIFILELTTPWWENVDETQFRKIQVLLTDEVDQKSLWICQKGRESFGANDVQPAPAYSLIDGISRVLNSELEAPALSILKLQTQGDVSCRQLSHIAKVTKRLSQESEKFPDTEYVEANDQLLIPRMVQSASLTEALNDRLKPKKTITRKWKESSSTTEAVPLRLIVGTPGLLNTMQFVQDHERDAVPLDEGEIEIEVCSVGLNYRDVLIALGRLQNAEIGCECAGVVSRLGSDVADLLVGDRVVALVLSGYRSYVRVDHRLVIRIPPWMTFEIAASMLVNHFTAWSAFHDICRVRNGETVLIHSAAGGTGQAAVQVAKYLGANVLATTSTSDKKALLKGQYGLQEDHIFNSRKPSDFSLGVNRVTNGRGVDAVLNSLSGQSLSATWECMAPFGRFVEIGKKDILARKQLSMAKFEENVSFHAFDVGIVCKHRPESVRPLVEKILGLHKEGHLTPAQPMQIHGVSEIEKMFRTMQGGKTMGKVVVSMKPAEDVVATVDTVPSTRLETTASYVIAGGLGGLGMTMAAWLVDRGARNLVLISRSGPRSAEAQAFVKGLRQKGVSVATPRCDVSDYESLRCALTECAKSMPPVRGAIQASMVLRDAAFAGMTYRDWSAATRPKVQGSWNMHLLLPADMDFFIGLSSAAGAAGGRGQANYAAGNTYIDALMRYRAARGQAATTLDLGVFLDVGFLTQDKDLRARWVDHEHTSVTERDLLSLLDIYCSSATNEMPYQAAFGIAGFVGGKSTSYFFKKPMLRGLVLEQQVASFRRTDSKDARKVDFALVFANASCLDDVVSTVCEALLSKLAQTLALDKDELGLDTPLHVFGVDSLVAVELRSWFAREVFADLAVFDLLGGATARTASVLAVSKTQLRK
ncbi:hypothetical protein FSARC_6646 [Fusarium sarcochroum]|uniref:Polyketide synthase n=1 Tax=Fusarium sarcochroum TaxID=1208366 RepID=A0A8H4TWZ3_9HYPO|nr:hypothetical protein FSARC_6646 [Fusarium sarcochroum]